MRLHNKIPKHVLQHVGVRKASSNSSRRSFRQFFAEERSRYIVVATWSHRPLTVLHMWLLCDNKYVHSKPCHVPVSVNVPHAFYATTLLGMQIFKEMRWVKHWIGTTCFFTFSDIPKSLGNFYGNFISLVYLLFRYAVYNVYEYRTKWGIWGMLTYRESKPGTSPSTANLVNHQCSDICPSVSYVRKSLSMNWVHRCPESCARSMQIP